MDQNPFIKKLDLIFTSLCELYIYRHHKIILSPFELRAPYYLKLFRLWPFNLWRSNYDAEFPRWNLPEGGMMVSTVFYTGKVDPALHEQSEARRFAEEYWKAVGDACDVETVYINLRHRTAEERIFDKNHKLLSQSPGNPDVIRDAERVRATLDHKDVNGKSTARYVGCGAIAYD